MKLLRDEARAYLRMGLLAAGGRRAVHDPARGPGPAVLFVPGVGANGSQFLALKRALEPLASGFDSHEYFTLRDPRRNAEGLARAIDAHRGPLVVVGHSLGGFLLRLALQSDRPPERVVGYAAICSPLHGTWRARLAPSPGLRQLAPDSELLQWVARTAPRLERWRGAIATVTAVHDQFVQPHESALLEGSEQLVLDDVAHAGSLFDPRVHALVRGLVARVSGPRAKR
jgi:pimeloyl-ACP methyl ester carboxylesterase